MNLSLQEAEEEVADGVVITLQTMVIAMAAVRFGAAVTLKEVAVRMEV